MPIVKDEILKSTLDRLGNNENGDDLIEVSGRYDCLFIDGNYYEEKAKDGKVLWKKVPDEKIEKLEQKNSEVADILVEHFDGRAVLREALRKLHPDDVEKIHKMLTDEKKNYKIKTREGHCIDMKVGNFILPIINDG